MSFEKYQELVKICPEIVEKLGDTLGMDQEEADEVIAMIIDQVRSKTVPKKADKN